MKKKRSDKQYIVCDEYDHSKPFNTRTEAVRECAIWRKEGRNAEVIRRIPEHLAARPAAIIPRFYERSAEQVFNHSQPIEVEGDVAPRWYERSLDDWDAPVYLQPELPSLQDALAMSPQELWMEHRGWSA